MRQIGVGTWACSDRERELVNQVLDSGRLSYGPMSRQLESEFASIHHCRYGVLSNSGTSSLQVAIQAMKELYGWEDGDEIIVPAITFVATVNAVLHNKLIPVLVDVNSMTYNIDVTKIDKALTDKTRAIIPVHMFGQPADMAWIRTTYWGKYKLIEDACEAAFSMQAAHPVGSWGDVGCFSMYVAHLLTTGVGGIAITNHADLAAKMRSIVNHGRDGIYIDIDTEASKEVITRRFKFDTIGHSYRITEMEAALGVAQLENWDDMIKQRAYNANYLTRHLVDLELLHDFISLPYVLEGVHHSWMMYPIVMKHEDKWGMVNHLESRGIETREMMPLTNQPCYEGMFNEDDYPIAKNINECGFYIGCHQGLSTDDLDYIIEVMYEYHHGKSKS